MVPVTNTAWGSQHTGTFQVILQPEPHTPTPRAHCRSDLLPPQSLGH